MALAAKLLLRLFEMEAQLALEIVAGRVAPERAPQTAQVLAEDSHRDLLISAAPRPGRPAARRAPNGVALRVAPPVTSARRSCRFPKQRVDNRYHPVQAALLGREVAPAGGGDRVEPGAPVLLLQRNSR